MQNFITIQIIYTCAHNYALSVYKRNTQQCGGVASYVFKVKVLVVSTYIIFQVSSEWSVLLIRHITHVLVLTIFC